MTLIIFTRFDRHSRPQKWAGLQTELVLQNWPSLGKLHCVLQILVFELKLLLHCRLHPRLQVQPLCQSSWIGVFKLQLLTSSYKCSGLCENWAHIYNTYWVMTPFNTIPLKNSCTKEIRTKYFLCEANSSEITFSLESVIKRSLLGKL